MDKQEKKQELKTRVHPQQSRTKILNKPNMVEQGENHPARERYTFRGREKHWYTSELQGGNIIRALNRISTRKAKKWNELLLTSQLLRGYATVTSNPISWLEQEFISLSGVGCRPATAGVFPASVHSLIPGPSKRSRSYLSLMAERKAQQRNNMTVRKASAQKS